MPVTIFTFPTIPGAKVKVDNLRSVEQDDVVRFQPDVGESIDRVRHTAVVSLMVVSIRTNRAGVEDVDTFYRITISRVGRFTMLDPITDIQQTFKFTAPPEFVPVTEEVWDIGMQLMRLP